MSMFTECGQCGWIGPLADLKDHPTRPMPQDIGFCPERNCGAEIDEWPFDEAEYARRLAEYD